jgi:hypothetical protein
MVEQIEMNASNMYCDVHCAVTMLKWCANTRMLSLPT